ncbi:protein kinase domain-containing protein [Aquabacterium sp.]|uniref:protein kinase domain-containing protein n=1 Tax=Aquabacterium sp. TaxID=1872578 RepID=UPI002B72C53F|nr:protein kinase [Aquabacterium sp.]HSW03640.1 protein kinase [Aquabacterium sp.]
MTTPKPDDAIPKDFLSFTGVPPAPAPVPTPPSTPDDEVTRVMMPPPSLKSPAPGPGPATVPDDEATQVMLPQPLALPPGLAEGLPPGSVAARPPLSLPPRPGMPSPQPSPPSAWPPLPPAPPASADPVDEVTRVVAVPPHFEPKPNPLLSPRHDSPFDPRSGKRVDPIFGPDNGPELGPAIAPTIAVTAYEPTMVLKAGASKPRTMTQPDLSRLPQRAATLPGSTASAADGNMQQVGRYLIRERLGRGGMATVFKAHDPTLNRDVAIKFLHATLCADDEYRARFLREARAAGGLSHPNIVVVHDVGEIDGRPYMAMELIEGTSLADEVEHHKAMPIRDVVVMGMQLARALDYAHARGIVHRDIKPGNIMRLKGSHTIKVTDFGIAHMDELGEAQHTRVGDVLGTPQYMSPEQANGDKLDGRSDLFSTGIVLYQMLTGKRPFRGDTLVAVATRIATEDPTPINKQRAEVPASLRRVIDRCLAKQPANRFQTGRELSDALGKVLSELDEAALAKNRPRIVPLRVRWAAMMALIVAVVMGLTAAVITQRQYAAMMNQVSDYGASLARFIAQQNAAAVLGDDWAQVEVAVQEVMKTRNFERITVIDPAGIVRVSSQALLVGQPYKAEGGESLGKLAGIAATRYMAQGESVLGFEAPVLFQDKQVGRVALGIPERPLTQVARLSISLMVVLAVVTVLAVAIAMYFVANWFAKPIQLVADSMAEIGKGRFDHRINEQRKDEFGQLYAAFDNMAQALQDRATAGMDGPVTPSPAAPPTVLPRRGGGPDTARHRPG